MIKRKSFHFQVSWVRRRDWHILTADSKVYSRDERVRVSYADKPEPTWTLLIKFIRKEDEGIYDCQVNSEISTKELKIRLTIITNTISLRTYSNSIFAQVICL